MTECPPERNRIDVEYESAGCYEGQMLRAAVLASTIIAKLQDADTLFPIYDTLSQGLLK